MSYDEALARAINAGSVHHDREAGKELEKSVRGHYGVSMGKKGQKQQPLQKSTDQQSKAASAAPQAEDEIMDRLEKLRKSAEPAEEEKPSSKIDLVKIKEALDKSAAKIQALQKRNEQLQRQNAFLKRLHGLELTDKHVEGLRALVGIVKEGNERRRLEAQQKQGK